MHAAPDGTGSGVAVLRRIAGRVSLARTLPDPGKGPRGAAMRMSGMVLTHDAKLLVVTAVDRLIFYDVSRLTSGADNPLVGTLSRDGDPPGYFYVNVTSDDRFLFASEHDLESITVVNLADARRSGFTAASIVGRIPVGYGAVALSFSPDERYLYTTTQIAHERWRWPNECKPLTATSTDAAPTRPRGAVLVVDVARAILDPAHSVVATVSAGCDPIRLVLSPAGDRAYVTARSDNALLTFDATRLVTDSAHALIGSVATHTGPVGVAVIDGGRRIVVTNATRFAGTSSATEALTVIEAAAIGSGRNPLVGTVPAAAGPLELRVTADGRTLLLTNYAAQNIELINLARLPLSDRSQ